MRFVGKSHVPCRRRSAPFPPLPQLVLGLPLVPFGERSHGGVTRSAQADVLGFPSCCRLSTRQCSGSRWQNRQQVGLIDP